MTGCLEQKCDRHQGEPFVFLGGNTSADGSAYESGTLDEPFIHFPAGRTYDLVHGLSAAPGQFHAYLAFSECPMSHALESAGGSPRCAPVDENSGGPGLAESAGNQAIFEVRDDEILRVRNDTCADFYLRVVALTTSFDEPTTNDAGAE